MNDDLCEALLHAWFEGWTEQAPLGDPDPCMKRWWFKDPAWDELLRERFGAANAAAREGAFDAWIDDDRRVVGLILLLDQVSRNIHRGSPLSFAADARARQITHALVEAGRDAAMPLVHRYFVYMPLMHSEDLSDHRLGAERFAKLAEDARAAGSKRTGAYEGALDYMGRHTAIIEAFGRYPHRNEVLGRSSTPEERAHVEKHGGF